jgi:LysR family glycine cleavage system transcriptional activator
VQRIPSLNALRAFEAVARHESFTRAAVELHVSQAAASQQVRALEADLGFALMHRSGRQLLPTEAALAGLADLREGFIRIARSVRLMREHAHRQLLKIRVEPTFAATWLIARLQDFRDTTKGIDVLIDAALDLPDFDRESLDIAIHFGTGNYSGLNTVQLFRDDVVPVCSPALIHGSSPLKEPSDLRHHTLIHLETVPGYSDWPYWRAWLRAADVEGVDVEQGMRFTDHGMALQAAVDGYGVALGTTAIVSDYIRLGQLVQPFDRHLLTKFGYYLVWPRYEGEELVKVSAFRDWIITVIERQAT